MPRYKLSPEERAAEKERKENLRNIMKGLDVKSFDDLKDVFKLMVGEMLENGLKSIQISCFYTVCRPQTVPQTVQIKQIFNIIKQQKKL